MPNLVCRNCANFKVIDFWQCLQALSNTFSAIWNGSLQRGNYIEGKLKMFWLPSRYSFYFKIQDLEKKYLFFLISQSSFSPWHKMIFNPCRKILPFFFLSSQRNNHKGSSCKISMKEEMLFLLDFYIMWNVTVDECWLKYIKKDHQVQPLT